VLYPADFRGLARQRGDVVALMKSSANLRLPAMS